MVFAIQVAHQTQICRRRAFRQTVKIGVVRIYWITSVLGHDIAGGLYDGGGVGH